MSPDAVVDGLDDNEEAEHGEEFSCDDCLVVVVGVEAVGTVVEGKAHT